jgi:hypothetical protein
MYKINNIKHFKDSEGSEIKYEIYAIRENTGTSPG